MDAQTARLVDAPVVGLIKLHVDGPFPFATTFAIVACVGAVSWIVMDSRNEDACLVVEKRQGVGGNGKHRHPVGVTAQCADEVTVGGHGTDAAVILIKHRCTNHDTVADTVGRMIDRRDAIDDRVDVGGGVQGTVESQRFSVT